MKKHYFAYIIISLFLPLAALAANSGNSSGWAWAEKIGWAHFSGEDASADYGMKVTSDQITGYVWSEKAGWISLNCLNRFSCDNFPYAIVSDGVGNLSGFAWSEKGGWINFSGAGAVEYQVQADSSGNLSGYAWSEKLGWINMNDTGSYYAVTTASQAAFCENCDPCNPAVLYWPMNEAQGSTVHDQSPRGENSASDGTISGASWKPPSECLAGNCLGFNGSGNKVSRAYDTDLNAKTYGFSVGVWLRSAPVSAAKVFAARYDSAGWKMWLKSDGNVCFGIDDDSDFGTFAPDDSACSSGKNFADNEWHYVVGTKNAVLGSIQIYADARLENSDLNLTAIGSLSGTSPTLYVGVDSDGSSNSFAGSLDEFKIYDYPRSLDQIKADFNAGQAGLSSPRGAGVSVGKSPKWMTDGLVGHWKMDESSGTTVADASGNANTGTLTNAQETGTSDASGNSVTTMVDTDGSLSTTNDAYNNMILRFTAACGSIASGTERTITDYTGTPHTFTVATLAQAPDSCAYEVRHQTGGKFGNGVAFDKSNDFVNVGQGASLNVTNFTWQAWIKRNIDDNSENHIIDRGNWRQLYVLNKKLYLQVGTNYIIGTTTLAASTWYHTACTYDGTTWKIWLNGKLEGSATWAYAEATGDVHIGDYTWAPGYSFNGTIDDARIYNRALSPDEVKQLSEYGPGPVGWWKMDENVSGNGQTIKDYSGNGLNGTTDDGANNTGMDCTKQGKYGGACQFDGVDDYVNVADNNSLNSPKSRMTVEAWIKKKSNKAHNPVYNDWYGSSTQNKFGLETDSNGKVALNVGGIAGEYSTLTANTALNNDVWYHITAVYDNTTANDMKIFVNGVLDGQKDSAVNNLWTSSGYNKYIGGYMNGQYFDGLLDDVRIYNYARSSKQIVEDMNAGHPAPGSPVGSPVGYWKMDEGYGTSTTQDASQNNQDLTLSYGSGGSVPTWTTGGKFGRTLDFEKDNKALAYTADSGGLSITGDLTVSGWIKPESVTGSTLFDIAGKWDGANVSYLLAQYGTELRMYIDAAGNYKTTSGLGLAAGTWYYVSATYSASAQTVSLYVNGVDKGGSVTGTIPASIGDDVGRFQLGAETSSGTAANFFDGLIDEVKVYSSALTPEQIALDMNQGKELQLGGQSSATGATGQAAEYCVPGDATSCAGPAGEWKFDEKTGGSVNDTSGNGNLGTWSGTGTQHWTRGQFGSAGIFNGSSDRVDMGTSSTLNPTGAITISTWVKPPSSPTLASGIVARNSSYKIRVDQGGDTQFQTYVYVDGGLRAPDTYPSLTKNVWQQIVMTYDSTSHILAVYKNGALVSSKILSGLGAYTLDSNSNNFYTGYDAGSGAYFNGSIDQTRVFDYARTPAQIAWDFNRGKPVGWWKLDEGEGDKAYDSSGSGNTGTLTTMDPPNDWVAGKFGKGLDFDGSSDLVYINPSFSSLGNFTYSAWIKTSNADERYILHGSQGLGERFYIEMDGTGPVYGVKMKNGTSYTTETAIGVNDNHWHHIVFTGNGTNIVTYLDGAQKQSDLLSNPSSYNNLYIGGDSAGKRFQGQIDDVRVYNYALTAEQVKQVMNEGSVVRFGE